MTNVVHEVTRLDIDRWRSWIENGTPLLEGERAEDAIASLCSAADEWLDDGFFARELAESEREADYQRSRAEDAENEVDELETDLSKIRAVLKEAGLDDPTR